MERSVPSNHIYDNEYHKWKMRNYTVSAHSRNGFGTKKSMKVSIQAQMSILNTDRTMSMVL